MEINELMGKAMIIEAVEDTYRGGSQSTCFTMMVAGVGTVKMSLKPERGGDLHMRVRQASQKEIMDSRKDGKNLLAAAQLLNKKPR